MIEAGDGDMSERGKRGGQLYRRIYKMGGFNASRPGFYTACALLDIGACCSALLCRTSMQNALLKHIAYINLYPLLLRH